MGSEPVEELPEDLEAWVAERAAADDVSRAEVVRRLMAAHRLLDEEPDRLGDADALGLGSDASDGPPGDGPELDELESRVAELAERVSGLEADLDEKITDVRKRVIQVKRETDAKAPEDHDHPSIERRIDEGFGNYEEILEYLTERTEALEEGAEDRNAKLRTVANAVVDLRRRVATLEGEAERRAAVADLRETANRRGISTAACGSCGESVRLGLLDEPACPHCESPFDGVESGGWFRSDRLTVGDRPALEAGPAPAEAADASDQAASSPRPNGGEPRPSEAAGDGPAATDAGERDEAADPSDGAGSGTTGSSEAAGGTVESSGAAGGGTADPPDAAADEAAGSPDGTGEGATGDSPSGPDGVADAPNDGSDGLDWSDVEQERDDAGAGSDADEEVDE